jgi:hypothetical protein
MRVDNVAAATVRTSSGMATPLYGLSGIQITLDVTAVVAIMV